MSRGRRRARAAAVIPELGALHRRNNGYRLLDRWLRRSMSRSGRCLRGGVTLGLMPTFGIRSQQEQEKRATSCLLAVMHGVPEFGYALLKELDAPKAPVIETFAEVRFKDANGKTVIPDGAIVCRRGKKTWTCLVEVKTGSARLKDDQVNAYLDVAKTNGFDGVLTISTEITATSAESPVSVDRRKLRTGYTAVALLVVARADRGDRPATLSRHLGSRPGMDPARTDPLPQQRGIGRGGL